MNKKATNMIRQIQLFVKKYYWVFMVIIILLALNSLLFPVGEIKRFQRTPQELYEKIKIEAAEYKG